MSDTPPEFDLKFLPDWLKEGPAEKNYAEYEGRSEYLDRPPRDGRGRDDRGGGRGDRRGGPRPGGPGGGRGDSRGGPRGPRPGDGGGQRRDGGGGRRDDRRGGPQGRRFEQPHPTTPPPPPVPRADVRIDFLPEAHGAANIARQIKQSGKAYPLFGTGRLFLERPERHRVRITTLDSNVPLHQIGDGPVSFDRAAVERNSFRTMREQYYKEEVTQGEPIKGNFANVARASGVLIGPTNHHSYQPTLRRIYEERFSRRMSFTEFVQYEIEVVTDEQVINDWKEQARSTTTYTTLQEAEPIVFKTAFEAEQHFRKVYLPQLVKSGTTLECTGQASRALPDRSVSNAVREAWEKERAFPAGLVNYLRPYLLEAGLHFFKHRKRVLYISPVKPIRNAVGQALSPSVALILGTIEATPKCSRRTLATKILGEHHEAPEVAEQKAALARDLHYLIHTGNVIEFHDGTLDLPLIPGGQAAQGGSKQAAGESGKAKPANTEAVTDSQSAETAESTEEAAIVSSAAVESTAGDFHEQATGSETLTTSESLHAGEVAGEQIASESATLSSAEPSAQIAPQEALTPYQEAPLQSEVHVETQEPAATLHGEYGESQELATAESLVDDTASATDPSPIIPVLTDSNLGEITSPLGVVISSSEVAVATLHETPAAVATEEPAPAS